MSIIDFEKYIYNRLRIFNKEELKHSLNIIIVLLFKILYNFQIYFVCLKIYAYLKKNFKSPTKYIF